MRLYHQLTEEEQHQAFHFVIDVVIEDVIEGNIELDETEENAELDKKLQAAREHVKTLPNTEDKGDYLLSDPLIQNFIFDVVDDMVRQAYYHDPGEIAIYTADLSTDEGETEEENSGSGSKPPYTLN